MTIGVRPANEADIDAVFEIARQWKTTPDWSRSQFAAPGTQVIVAEIEGRVVGFVVYRVVSGEAQLWNVAVHSDETRHGVGRRLLEEPPEGCRRVTLEVAQSNEPAIALYQARGFRVVGRRAKYYNDGSDAFLMDLVLK